MDQNLQNMEEAFHKAYQEFEEEPSAQAWDKLNAALDKEDADKYKKRFIGWKRMAVLLLFLLSGFVIYEVSVVITAKSSKALTDKNNSAGAAAPTGEKTNGAIIKENNKNSDESIQGASRSVEVSTDKTGSIQELAETKQNGKAASIRYKVNISNSKHPGSVDNNNTTFEITATTPKVNAGAKHKIPETMEDNSQSLSRILVPAVELPIKQEINPSAIKLPVLKQIALPDPLLAKSNSKAKNKVPSSSFKPYWSLTVFASNDWGQYQLDNDVQDNTARPQNEKAEISKRERHEGSFSAGILATRQLTRHIGLKTGIIYSNAAIAIAPQEIYAAKQTNGNIAYKYVTSSGYSFVKPAFGVPPAIGDSIQFAMAQHNLQVVSIPLMVSYKFDKNRFSIVPSAGITANFITSAKVKTEVTDALNTESVTINRLDGMRTFFAGFIGDVNLQYNYNSRWSFNLLPGFKYAFTPITKTNVVKTYPYSFSIGAGITYKL